MADNRSAVLKKAQEMDDRRQAQIARQKEIIDRLLDGDSAELINADQEAMIISLRVEVAALQAEVRSVSMSGHPSAQGMYGLGRGR